MVETVLDSGVDGLFQITGSKSADIASITERAFQTFGLHRHVTPMVGTSTDRNEFLLLGRQCEELAHGVEESLFGLVCYAMSSDE